MWLCIMRDQQFYDRVQISEFVLQIMTLIWAMNDVPNNNLMEELQKQNKEYLGKIVEQNNEILEKLAELG